MKRKCLAFLLILSFFLNITPVSYAQSKIDQEIAQKSTKQAVMIEFYAKALPGNEKNGLKKRENYIQHLKEKADTAQQSVRAYLKERGIAYESYYIVNMITTTLTPDQIREIAAMASVKKITPNNGGFTTMTAQELAEDPGNEYWNLEMLHVMNAWNKYNTKGEGVTIGFIDSGAVVQHEALLTAFRGYQEDGQLIGEGNWIDLIDHTPLPTDQERHGTATVSVCVGKSAERPIGVAPGAKWIAARAFSDAYASNDHILKAAQWMLAPGGDPAKAPQIINNSWGGQSSTNPWFKEMLQTWVNAGIFPVFAAGNTKSQAQPYSIENPASLPLAFAVGSVDRTKKLSPFSRRGPSLFDEAIIKPEVVAPGVKVFAASGNGGYGLWSGTSIAAPHVSGIVALILSVNPDLSVSKIRDILIESADPLKDQQFSSTPNMGYGYGIINAEKALALAGAEKVHGDMERISGANRFETSLKIARKFYPKVQTVYIANGYRFTDGLAIGALTAKENGPILLSDKEVDADILQYIETVAPQKVVIIGGESSISQRAATILKARVAQTQRIHGQNRYATAAAIAEQMENGKEVFLVSGLIDADAISVSGISSRQGVPILLTEKNSLPQETLHYLEHHKITNVHIVGGNTQISDTIERRLNEMDINTSRIAGKDRYETAALVNKQFIQNTHQIFLANGVNTADALAVSPVARLKNAAIQISDRDHLAAPVKDYLSNLNIQSITLLGGHSSLSAELEKELSHIFK